MGFSAINDARDVAAYAGKIVAYKADVEGSYFFEYNHKINEISFGYIDRQSSNWGNREFGYGMDRIIKKGCTPCSTALVDSLMQSYCRTIYMRETTKSELDQILRDVKNGVSEMQYARQQDVTDFIEWGRNNFGH